MSYALFSETGYRRDIASVGGYFQLVRFCLTTTAQALRTFIEKGETNDIEQVKKDLDEVIPKATDETVAASLKELRQGLNGVNEIAIISDY